MTSGRVSLFPLWQIWIRVFSHLWLLESLTGKVWDILLPNQNGVLVWNCLCTCHPRYLPRGLSFVHSHCQSLTDIVSIRIEKWEHQLGPGSGEHKTWKRECHAWVIMIKHQCNQLWCTKRNYSQSCRMLEIWDRLPRQCDTFERLTAPENLHWCILCPWGNSIHP